MLLIFEIHFKVVSESLIELQIRDQTCFYLKDQPDQADEQNLSLYSDQRTLIR